MKINPKVTGALAWTGLVLVLAVPAADMLGGKPEAKANLTSDMDQVQAATTQPAAKHAAKPAAKPVVPAIETAAGSDVVTDFVKSGKKLPSYISGNDAPVVDTASTPKAPVKKPGTITVNADGTIQKPGPAPAATDDSTVASIKPNLIAPIPLPLSARPKSFPSTTMLPAPTEQPLIIDETTVASTGPVPPADIVPDDQLVTGDQLDEWDSGSLAEYLARKGLMSDASAPSTSQYDADGFYLSDGPNQPRRSRVIIVDR
ncbi:MAG TPA: hypothetical protein VIN06_10330 [Devosia sp.]